MGDNGADFVRHTRGSHQRLATGLATMKHAICSIENVLANGEVLQSDTPVRLPLTSDAGAEGVQKHLTEPSPCFLVGKPRGVDGFHHRTDHGLKASVHGRGDYEAPTATSRTTEERAPPFNEPARLAAAALPVSRRPIALKGGRPSVGAGAASLSVTTCRH